jgi:hypothetical protein
MSSTSESRITINRAPVLTLWAAVVAERLGYNWDEALTLGRAVAGMNAATKARALGITRPKEGAEAEKKTKLRTKAPEAVSLLGRLVPAMRTPAGLRAATDGRADSPESVERYLRGKFREAYEDARESMRALARALAAGELEAQAFRLYEDFRPEVPRGTRGWGAKGELDLGTLRDLARRFGGGAQSKRTTRRVAAPPSQRARKK